MSVETQLAANRALSDGYTVILRCTGSVGCPCALLIPLSRLPHKGARIVDTRNTALDIIAAAGWSMKEENIPETLLCPNHRKESAHAAPHA